MTLPVILPFIKPSISTGEDAEDVEIATLLLIIFDELDKKEALQKITKVLLPFIAVEYKDNKYFMFNEILKNYVKIRAIKLDMVEKSLDIVNLETTNGENFISDMAKIKHLYQTPSTLEIELASICSPSLCKGITDLFIESTKLD